MKAPSREEARRFGLKAESICALYLRARGWRIIERGFKTGRGSGAGEVDIIARKANLLCFIEVKARQSETEAAEALTPAQRERITRGADAFLGQNPELATLDARFDLMLVTPGQALPTHIPDAWRPGF
jgi:putative endonuclease